MWGMHLKSCAFALLAAFCASLPAMAEKKIIVPAEFAPRPGAPTPNFSPGVLVDGTLYIAGQMGTDLKTRQIPDSFESEVTAALDSIGIILKEAGMTYSDVVSVTVYLTDIELFGRMNAVYIARFPEPRPARAAIGVAKLAIPKAHIEISVTAKK